MWLAASRSEKKQVIAEIGINKFRLDLRLNNQRGEQTMCSRRMQYGVETHLDMDEPSDRSRQWCDFSG